MSILELAGVLAFTVVGVVVVCYTIHWLDMLHMRYMRHRRLFAMLRRFK